MDPLADKVHADGGPHCRDVPGSEGRDHRFQGRDDILSRHDDFVVVAPDIFRHLPGIFEVDGVNVHTDGKSLQGAVQDLCRHAADKGGIQTA